MKTTTEAKINEITDYAKTNPDEIFPAMIFSLFNASETVKTTAAMKYLVKMGLIEIVEKQDGRNFYRASDLLVSIRCGL